MTRFTAHFRALLLKLILFAWACLFANASGQGNREIYPDGVTDDGGTIPNANWTIDEDLPEDVFTFVRLRHRGYKWRTDYPRADIHFSRRLQELTSFEMSTKFLVLDIDDPRLFQYPIAFMSNMRGIEFSEDEAKALRNYLNNGGFILADDLWGDQMWEDIYEAMKTVFPDKEPVELTEKHPIFNAVFDLGVVPQVPSHDAAAEWREKGLDNHYEPIRGEREENLNTPHFQAWFDDHGRMIMLVNHNNDIADGWEEEGFQDWFFHQYSEKICFPLGINILFYVMTH